MDRFDQVLVDLLVGVTGRSKSELSDSIELPPQPGKGDRALPCFRWAKEEGVSPQALAERWAAKLRLRTLPPEVDRLEVTGGYLNFFLKRDLFTKGLLQEIRQREGRFGFVETKEPDLMVVEFSSPNIAKPFSIGHLRSTNIGAALSRILEARGWRVVKINHLGDWGTQFGKLMVAYRRWGNADMLGDNPIQNLFKLYVRFHEEEVSDPTLIAEAREWFARLEQGDEEAKELWGWFRDLTMMELKRLYQMLGIEFDHYWGESFYGERIPRILKELEEKKLTRVSEDATIVDLEPHGLPVCIVKKSDDSSLYLTRDLAAAVYRYEQFQFERMLYVVGSPQKLHFQQVFKILELLGYSWATNCEHIAFGHISFGDESMSTRKGNVVFLSDVLGRAVELARKVVEEKNPDLEDKDTVARDVGLAAILFADLSAKRIKDVRFLWEQVLSFDGETGPYLQYTLVRTESLIRRYDRPIDLTAKAELLTTDEEVALVRQLSLFPAMLKKSELEREPFILAQYLLTLARTFNRFYTAHRILDAPEDISHARMLLVACAGDVMKAGLKLLGIPTLERM